MYIPIIMIIHLDAYLEHPPRYANTQQGMTNATNCLSTFAFASISIISTTHQQDALSARREQNVEIVYKSNSDDPNLLTKHLYNQLINLLMRTSDVMSSRIKTPKRTSLSIHFQYCHQLDDLRRNSGQDIDSLHHFLLLAWSSCESLLLSECDDCRWSPWADRHIGVWSPNDGSKW
uniref:Uncharacterized protein n=1 Tax=Glossina pallidipes TaxID=7398 RepID=A0A1A9Z2T0_GLOPL